MSLEIIKVCGITNIADARFAADNGATALGFIFYPGSPRAVRVEMAAMMSAVLPAGVLRVGVFVNETPEQIRRIGQAARLDVVQLHGDETPGNCAELDGLRVWKAIRVGEGFDVNGLAPYRCEAFLLDTARDGVYGGTGRTFPWPIAVEAKRFGKVVLAGGLDGDNVAKAIQAAMPWGVDASSRLEQKPGMKDHEKVRRYLEAARATEKS